MTKLSKALGEKYQAKRASIFIRSFELGGHTFKVRIPYVEEADRMYKKIFSPDEEQVERIYQELAEPLAKFKDMPTEESEFEFLENDILIKGKSLRETAKNKVMTENRVVEYIKLLVPETPDMSLDDITYAEIEAEFPWTVQLALVEKITEAISPGYKEARGN